MNAQLINRIDENTSLLVSDFSSLKTNQLNWKPNPETWSIGQNLEHLMQINTTYGEVFYTLKLKTIKLPFYGRSQTIASFFGKMILDAVEPSRNKKGKTFSIWEPTQSDISENIFNEFSSSQELLKKYALDLHTHFEEKTIIHTPLSKYITLPLDTAFDIILTHQMRHYNQANELLEIIERKTIAA